MKNGFESFGICFDSDLPINTLTELAALADDSDFGSLWIQENERTSTIVHAATLLQSTKRLVVGTGITSPFRRHPLTLATDTANLNELSNNRFILGLGAAERLIKTFRIPAKSIDGMKDTLAIIRGVYASDKFTYEGKVFSVTTPQTRLAPKLRLYLGAIGPRMLDLTGKMADGLILSRRATFSRKYTKYAIDRMQKAAKDAGRDLSSIDSVGFFETFVSKDGNEARRFAKKTLGTYTIPGTPQIVLNFEDISKDEVEKVKTHHVKGNLNAAISSVTDNLVDKFALAGTPAECVEKLRKHTETGLKCPILYIHGPDRKIATRLAIEKIIKELC